MLQVNKLQSQYPIEIQKVIIRIHNFDFSNPAKTFRESSLLFKELPSEGKLPSFKVELSQRFTTGDPINPHDYLLTITSAFLDPYAWEKPLEDLISLVEVYFQRWMEKLLSEGESVWPIVEADMELFELAYCSEELPKC